MRYYIPELTLVRLSPAQAGLQDKFGGLPWGLPPERWPLCRECSKPLTHLVQLVHHAQRLDLRKAGRSVLVFLCQHEPGRCMTGSADSGANAFVFLDPEEVTGKPTSPPDADTPVSVEAQVVSWRGLEDLVPEEEQAIFSDDARFAEIYRRMDADELAEGVSTYLFENLDEVRDSIYCDTKIGGVPCWVQNAAEGPKAPFRFVAQMKASVVLAGRPPTRRRCASSHMIR